MLAKTESSARARMGMYLVYKGKVGQVGRQVEWIWGLHGMAVWRYACVCVCSKGKVR